MRELTEEAIVYRVTSGLSFINARITKAIETACPEFCAGMKQGFLMFHKYEMRRDGHETEFIEIPVLIRRTVFLNMQIITEQLMPLLTGLESNEMLLPADEEIKGAFDKLLAYLKHNLQLASTPPVAEALTPWQQDVNRRLSTLEAAVHSLLHPKKTGWFGRSGVEQPTPDIHAHVHMQTLLQKVKDLNADLAL